MDATIVYTILLVFENKLRHENESLKHSLKLRAWEVENICLFQGYTRNSKPFLRLCMIPYGIFHLTCSRHWRLTYLRMRFEQIVLFFERVNNCKDEKWFAKRYTMYVVLLCFLRK